MKLRQKLAVVLASAMVVTAVPVVTMAASTNSLSKETLKVKEDCEFTNISTANAVKIKFTDNNGDNEVFYLDLDNAEWDEDTLAMAAEVNGNFSKTGDKEWTYTGNNGVTVKYERQSDETMKITVDTVKADEVIDTDKVIQIPLVVKAKDGDAKVSVVSKGGSTTVSQGTFVFATTADKKMTVTAKDDKTFYTKGDLSEISIEEAYAGALKDGGEFTIELNDSDFNFTTGKFTLEGKYGFSSYKETTVQGEIAAKDGGKLTVKLPAISTANTRGTWVIKDLEVKSTNKKPEQGDFLVDIKGDDLVAEKTNLKVATVSEYGVYVKMKDDKAEEVKGGRIEEIEFEIGETVEDSMISGREFEMTLDNGHWDYKGLVAKAIKEGKLTKTVLKVETVNGTKVAVAGQDKDDWKEQALYMDKNWLAKQLVDNAKDWDMATMEAEFDENDEDMAIIETIIFTIGKDKDGKQVQSNDDCDKIEFKTNVCVPVDKKDKEKVTLKVSGRAIENEVSTTAINIINPFNVTFEQAVLKTGLQGQISGSITLTETDKDMFEKGNIKFSIKDKDENDLGIYLVDCTVETSGGIKGTESEVNEGKGKAGNIEVTLNRTSKEAATITLKDMKFTTDRTVPEGTYDLKISGTGITDDGHDLKLVDFIKISTSNTQDITASGLAKGTAKFVIGESKYTLNDKEVTMDAPSYIQDPGYTMVPVRYVAQAFGVAEADILFGKGTVTLFAGERTISLTAGSNVAVVNGNNVAMAAKVVIKDGRTFVPAGQIASLLGIKSTWDSASKTATFENK